MSEKTEQEPAAGADLTQQQDLDAAAPAEGDSAEPELSAQTQSGSQLETESQFDADSDSDTDSDAEADSDAGSDGEADERDEVEERGASGRSRRSGKDRTAQLEREGEVAADFLERLLDIADLDGDIDVDIDGDRASVAIIDSEEGRVPRRLVGQDGRVLEALQELTRMAVQAATGERSRLMLDVADHRAQRREAVVSVTRQAIDEVRASGRPTPLKPMGAFERKVAHDEVLAAGLISESEGTEPSRHVVVLPA